MSPRGRRLATTRATERLLGRVRAASAIGLECEGTPADILPARYQAVAYEVCRRARIVVKEIDYANFDRDRVHDPRRRR